MPPKWTSSNATLKFMNCLSLEVVRIGILATCIEKHEVYSCNSISEMGSLGKRTCGNVKVPKPEDMKENQYIALFILKIFNLQRLPRGLRSCPQRSNVIEVFFKKISIETNMNNKTWAPGTNAPPASSSNVNTAENRMSIFDMPTYFV